MVGLLGVDLGPRERMLVANPTDNAKGYWEQQAVMELNDDLLACLGGSWYRPPELRSGWERDRGLDPLYERARALVDEHFDDGGRWGWKDPRFSITLPFWRRLVGSMTYVVCVRDPHAVAASLAARDAGEHPVAESLALWLTYTASALSHTGGQRRLTLMYEDWFERPDVQFDRLARFVCGTEPPPEGWEERAREFLDGRLRHHESRAESSGAEGGTPPEVAAAYALLREARPLDELERLLGGLSSSLAGRTASGSSSGSGHGVRS
jgi:hypothetical protein